VLHAVNHDGDSDSTGTICGYLLGAVSRLQVSRRGMPPWLRSESPPACAAGESVRMRC
jgi:hypothetical protein